MKMYKRNGLAITLAVLLIAFLTLLLSESQKSSKEPDAKEVSTNGLSTLLASQKISSQTNQPLLTIRNNLSAVTNPIAATLPSGTNATDTNYDGQISASALKQIAALEKEKESRTPTQQKIDSQLLYADKMRRGVPIAEGVPTQRVDLDKDDQGRILVDIKADVTDALLQYIKTLGGNVVNDFPQYQAIRAGVPLANIENLAARSEVRFVEPAVRAMNNNVDSQGDYTHQANTARTTFGVNGTGVKVGVLSDDVAYLNNSQIAGKVTILSGQSGVTTEGEGTAMLEIVNDLAPGAQLYFATAEGGDANFANNIQQLQAAGCNIIVDDVLSDDESPFQDGIVAQAVNSVTANGVLYFSAAANSGNKDDGTSGTWEGDFVDSGDINDALLPPNSGHVHNFGGGMLFDKITTNGPAGNELTTVLFWSDPLGASTNDYDLYLLDPTGSNVIASSTNPQNGTQNPYECIPNQSSTTNPAVGDLIVIVKFSGAGRFLHLSTGRGELAISTQGSTRGHDCATNAFDVAAVNAYVPFPGSPNPYGSYPNPFTGGAANPVETFSSDGFRRVFYQANGTPITPSNFSSTGGAVRQKPDITAADGVTTDVPNFGSPPPYFFGTSAAAPHAAAIAALMKSYNPSITASQIRAIFTNTALDIMATGWDRDSGAGIVMALAALENTPAPPQPNLTRDTDNLNNTTPHVGDTIAASLTITNNSCSGGGAAAGTFHVGFYFSSSSSFSGVSPFYEASVGGCPANSTTSLNQNILISAGTAPGTYYLGYKIDDENEVAECNEGDNGIYYWTITVLPPPQPDLTKFTDSLNNSSPRPGDTITASITVTNESCSGGSTNSRPFHVGFYGLSTSTSFAGLTPFYELQVNGCPSNGVISTDLNITITSSTPTGTYYLGYKIDDENEVAECDENNNGIFYWTVNVTLNPIDTTPPTISITLPTSASTYNTILNSIIIGGTASDNVGVTQVTWSNNRGGSGTALGTTSWTAFGINLQNGQNVITVYALDAAGNAGQAVLTVTYNPLDVTPPTINITSPTTASTYMTASSSINLSGTASDNIGVTQVTWNNNRGGNGAANGTNAWTVNGVGLQTGTNVITVTAHDAAGNIGQATLNTIYGLPILNFSQNGNKIVLNWPTNAVGFELEYATNLPTTNWFIDSSSPYIVNGQYTVTNTVSTGTRFYRLAH
jgi:Subtilase family/CARDB/Bacterial Ig domain